MKTRLLSGFIPLALLELQGCKSGAITTLGRGGSDLTATTIGKALGLREIQVNLSHPRG